MALAPPPLSSTPPPPHLSPPHRPRSSSPLHPSGTRRRPDDAAPLQPLRGALPDPPGSNRTQTGSSSEPRTFKTDVLEEHLLLDQAATWRHQNVTHLKAARPSSRPRWRRWRTARWCQELFEAFGVRECGCTAAGRQGALGRSLSSGSGGVAGRSGREPPPHPHDGLDTTRCCRCFDWDEPTVLLKLFQRTRSPEVAHDVRISFARYTGALPPSAPCWPAERTTPTPMQTFTLKHPRISPNHRVNECKFRAN